MQGRQLGLELSGPVGRAPGQLCLSLCRENMLQTWGKGFLRDGVVEEVVRRNPLGALCVVCEGANWAEGMWSVSFKERRYPQGVE